MRVAFDFQIFTLQQYGGISRYFCRLASLLHGSHDVSVKIIAPLHVNAHLDELQTQFVSGTRVRQVPRTGRALRAVNRLLARPQTAAFRPDIVHETYFAPSSYAPKTAARVVTVYDMIHEHFPSLFLARDLVTEAKRSAVQRADHVICISHHTRKDLLEIFDVSPDKVSVVYLGFDALGNGETSQNQARLPDGRPFLLYVGYRAGHKNFDGFIRAFTSSPSLKQDFSIVCFGGGALNERDFALLDECGLPREQVFHISGSDAELGTWYRGATAFVCPSLYEGFGIPPLEAMSAGCPVICSDTSSLPEVVGTAGEYFDPASIDSIRAALHRVTDSTERREQLIFDGHARLKQFSWENTARETLAAYRRIA